MEPVINRGLLFRLIIFLISRNRALEKRWNHEREIFLIRRSPVRVLLQKLRRMLSVVRQRVIVTAYRRGYFTDLLVLSSLVRVIKRCGWSEEPCMLTILNEHGK